MRENEIRELRRKAETAVSDMADSELKTKAFEVILSHLLSEPSRPSVTGPEPIENGEGKPSKTQTATSCTARILVLKDDGFFAEQRTIAEIKEELARHGWHYSLGSLSGKLQLVVQRRELRRVKEKVGKRDVWKYSVP